MTLFYGNIKILLENLPFFELNTGKYSKNKQCF